MNQLVMDRASRSAVPAARPVRDPRAAAARRPHETRSAVAVAVGVLAILVLGTWSLAQGWGRGAVVGPGELAVGGGIARIDGVISAAAPEQEMPGMGTDDAPVAEGMRRISVEVTLQAGTEEVPYAADRFTLVVDGQSAERRTDRDILPGDLLPAGTQLSGTIAFDVPVEATSGILAYDGGRGAELALPAGDEPVATSSEQTGPQTPTGTDDASTVEGDADEH